MSSTGEISALEAAIIKQVEHYFGDVNIQQDKFLQRKFKLDEGWVTLNVLTTFNRLARLSKNTDVIATALQKSTSGLIEVSEDNKKVRRIFDLPLFETIEKNRKDYLERTVYAKGFTDLSDIQDYGDVTKIESFFNEHGEIDNVIMRRGFNKQTRKRYFKGSVFVTFKRKEDAEKFVNNTNLEIDGRKLFVGWTDNDYLDKEEIAYQNIKKYLNNLSLH